MAFVLPSKRSKFAVLAAPRYSGSCLWCSKFTGRPTLGVAPLKCPSHGSSWSSCGYWCCDFLFVVNIVEAPISSLVIWEYFRSDFTSSLTAFCFRLAPVQVFWKPFCFGLATAQVCWKAFCFELARLLVFCKDV